MPYVIEQAVWEAPPKVARWILCPIFNAINEKATADALCACMNELGGLYESYKVRKLDGAAYDG